jgi:hypothetical protein
MNLTESPVEFILSFDGAKELIWDRLTFKELNHLRACSKGLQKMVSDKSEEIVANYTKMINRKIDRLQPIPAARGSANDLSTTCFDTGYIVIYNYYHCLTKHTYLLMNPRSHTELQRLMKRLHSQMKLHYGKKYAFDTDHYNISDHRSRSGVTRFMQWYSLFDLMTGIYLANTGRKWSSFHWDKEGLDRMEYLQGKLLP